MHSKHILSVILVFLTISICSLIFSAFLYYRNRNQSSNLDSQCSKLDTSVLILGAGMAGIIAAKTLQDKGLTDFLVIEAQPQIGGRMKKLEINPGVVVELGANWIEGIDPTQPEKHPIYALAQHCGGIKGSYADSRVVYNATGANITSNLRNGDLQAANRKLVELSISRAKEGLPDISIRQGLTESGWDVISDEDKWLDWINIDFEYAESPERSSLLFNIPEPTFINFGNPNLATVFLVTDQDGYVKLVECLADEIFTEKDTRLHLNEIVTDIQWSSECVCVTTDRVDGQHKYCGAYGLFTFSLGVLQSKTGLLKFQPPLPQWKLDAINRVNFANFLKIYAEFTNMFWDEIPYIGYASREKGYYPVFISQNLFLLNGSYILQITLTDELADRVVLQSETETKTQIFRVLESIYGSEATEPIRIVVADWKQDPLFYGTYSNIPLGVDGDTIPRIAEPIGRLYFSGEATSAKYIGYVHGAYFAGIDTANSILKDFYSSAPMMFSMKYLLVVSLWTIYISQ